MDRDSNGQVSEAEIAAAISASALWVEAEKRETLAAALDLLAVDAPLATEMVADGATPAVMRRLAQESARQLSRPVQAAEAAQPDVAELESEPLPGTGDDSSSNGNAP